MARSIAGSARLRRLADLTGPIRRARKIFRAAGALPSAPRFGTQPSRIIIRLPASILLELLNLVSSGHGFKVIPVGAELTTQQAADILDVPRTYLAKLLDGKEIPYVHKRGHRRIRADDFFAYKKKRDEIRSEALRELLEFDQEKGLL